MLSEKIITDYGGVVGTKSAIFKRESSGHFGQENQDV